MGRPSRWEQVAALIVSAMAVWQMLPEYQRKQITMRALGGVQTVLSRWARSEGHAGMGEELAGHGGQAARQYSVAFRLSLARDKCVALIETMRP